MEHYLESSFHDLYIGAVEAFPKTSRRQYSTHTVRVERVEWVPFRGLGTLFVKGLCLNEGRKNECVVVFKGVSYRDKEGGGSVSVASSAGAAVHVMPLSLEESEVLVRCSCADFRWRFAHWNREDQSLFGRPPRKYEALMRPGSSNPEGRAGACKHLMKMAKILGESGVFGSN